MSSSPNWPRRFNSSAHRRQNPMMILALGDAAERRRHAAFLSESGFVVLEVSDTSEASDFVGRFLPEIVVSDMGSLGLNFARRLRASPLSENVGLVGLAPALTQEREQIARAAGFDAVLEAPCM